MPDNLGLIQDVARQGRGWVGASIVRIFNNNTILWQGRGIHINRKGRVRVPCLGFYPVMPCLAVLFAFGGNRYVIMTSLHYAEDKTHLRDLNFA